MEILRPKKNEEKKLDKRVEAREMTGSRNTRMVQKKMREKNEEGEI